MPCGGATASFMLEAAAAWGCASPPGTVPSLVAAPKRGRPSGKKPTESLRGRSASARARLGRAVLPGVRCKSVKARSISADARIA